MVTRGIQLLKDQGVEHGILTYRFVKGARAAADSLNVPHESVVKSLVFRADDGSFLFALLGGDANVSLRNLGRASGHKHSGLMDAHVHDGMLAYPLSISLQKNNDNVILLL